MESDSQLGEEIDNRLKSNNAWIGTREVKTVSSKHDIHIHTDGLEKIVQDQSTLMCNTTGKAMENTL